MAQKTRLQITQLADSSFPTNNAKQITATDLRDFQADINDSFFNLIDDDAENVKFSDVGFTATNVQDAILELLNMQQNRPLFYIKIRLRTFSPAADPSLYLIESNYSGVTIDDVNATGTTDLTTDGVIVKIPYADTNVNLGGIVRSSPNIFDVTATSVKVELPLDAHSISAPDKFYQINFYLEYVAADYIIND